MSRPMAATRLNLVRARRRLERVRRGTNLLRRKREALVSDLFRIARPAVDAREAIDRQAATAYRWLLEALALDGGEGLAAYGWPARELAVELQAAQVWGLSATEILERPPVKRSVAARGTPPGSAGLAAVAAADEMETLVDMLLAAASAELLLQRLGEALVQTSRQVNTLEQRVTPNLEGAMRSVASALDEREREGRVRLQLLKTRRRR